MNNHRWEAEAILVEGPGHTLNRARVEQQRVASLIEPEFPGGKPDEVEAFGFWRTELSGTRPVLELPLDHRRVTGLETYCYAELPFELPEKLPRRLAQVSGEESVSLSAVYLTAWAILLGRYGNTRELWIACRKTDEDNDVRQRPYDPLSAAVIRVEWSNGANRGEVLRSVARRQATADKHGYVPDSLLSQMLAISAEEVRAPLGDAAFCWKGSGRRRTPGEREGFWGSAAPHSATLGDIALGISCGSNSVRASLLYRTDLFEGATIARMARHLIELLRNLASQPETPVKELNMVPEEERALILGRYAGSSSPYPRVSIEELFAEQVEKHGDAEAVVFGEDRLSYRELDLKSNQVAHFLRGEGVAAGDRIGIFMDRSAHMIVSMLGILKAGGAYLPIDPTYPPERLKFIADDTAVRLVLTESRVGVILPTKAPLFMMDGPQSPIRHASTGPVSSVSGPESVAVVIYTSGSTGQPKAACIPHRAVIRSVRDTNYVQVTPEDRVVQVASPSFDAAIKEIWLALLNGATLVGMRRETLLSPPALAQVLQRERITMLALNTAYVHQISREAPDVLKGVRRIFFGGEAAEPGPLRTLLKHLGPGVLVNCYGPAEGCVTTTFHEITSIPEDAVTMPIGRPVSNAQVYLLDSHLEPVPLGVPGEIYIGGAGVALGYWNRPELNAERFLPDPFAKSNCVTQNSATEKGPLLYRTGDLARMRENGELEFVGRTDDQIKIRGHRIELAEVRQAIEAHPQVKQVALLVREDQPGDKRLVAYVTLRGPLVSAPETLRQQAKGKLPSYMVPAAFVVVDSIPLNTNGKVDRKALPAPNDRPDLKIAYQAPASDWERRLTTIWSQMLRIDSVGANDNFFDLGGHSLLAARLVARLEKETGRPIPVTALYQAPTVTLLARKLESGPEASDWAAIIELRAGNGNGAAPFFCINWQGSNLGVFRDIAQLLEEGRPIYGLQPHALDERGEPLERVEAIASVYVEEMRKRQPEGPYHFGGVCIGGVLAFEIAQQLRAASQEVGLLLLIDTYMPGKLHYLHTRSGLTQYLDNHVGEMLLLPKAAQLRYVARWIGNGVVRIARALGWREPAEAAGQRRIAEASTRTALAYTAQPYEGKITHFLCSHNPHRSFEDRRLGWSSVAEGGLEVHMVPGSHFTWVEEPHLRVMARKLETCLVQANGLRDTSSRARAGRLTSEARSASATGSTVTRPRVGEFFPTIGA